MRILPRVIAHIDADCFFASVELRDFPHLKGKPVIVCSRTDMRGIVLAATYEARPFGIRAGTPIFKAVKLCPQAHILKSHFHKYSEISHRLMQILAGFTPDIEVASVDEAYLDLTGTTGMHGLSYTGIAEKIQRIVTRELGITVSIGLAPTKTLAKIGSDFKKPNGITVITPENREEFLRDMAVEKICGVGRNTKVLLNRYNIYTIGELLKAHALVRQLLGRNGLELITELEGTALRKVHQDDGPQKSLSHTSTFHDFLTDKSAIYDYSLHLLKEATRKLRREGLVADEFGFFLTSKDFQSFSCEHQFECPVSDDESFIVVFREILFEKCFKKGLVYRKSGFYLPHVAKVAPTQGSLFENTPILEKKNTFSNLKDGLMKRFGTSIVK